MEPMESFLPGISKDNLKSNQREEVLHNARRLAEYIRSLNTDWDAVGVEPRPAEGEKDAKHSRGIKP